MSDAIIYIDPDQPMNLQKQIRQKLVEGILNGSFPPGMKLPSSRKLARQLDLARNTAIRAYQHLITDGYLISGQRSGIFVNEEMLQTWVRHSGEGLGSSHVSSIKILVILPEAAGIERNRRWPRLGRIGRRCSLSSRSCAAYACAG